MQKIMTDEELKKIADEKRKRNKILRCKICWGRSLDEKATVRIYLSSRTPIKKIGYHDHRPVYNTPPKDISCPCLN